MGGAWNIKKILLNCIAPIIFINYQCYFIIMMKYQLIFAITFRMSLLSRFVGALDASVGHAVSASSYFDRLWIKVGRRALEVNLVS